MGVPPPPPRAWYAASLWQEVVTGYLLSLSKDTTAHKERKDSWFQEECHKYKYLFKRSSCEVRLYSVGSLRRQTYAYFWSDDRKDVYVHRLGYKRIMWVDFLTGSSTVLWRNQGYLLPIQICSSVLRKLFNKTLFNLAILDKINGKPWSPPPPQIKDGKMARFYPSSGFILDLWG